MADRIDTLEATLERFGSGTFNPVANAARDAAQARADARDRLAAKFTAPPTEGGANIPTIDEIEEGLASSYGLSNKQAKRAVALVKAAVQRDAGSAGAAQRDVGGSPAQRDVGGSTGSTVTVADVDDLRRSIADIRQLLAAE
jgi:hypothetical protein